MSVSAVSSRSFIPYNLQQAQSQRTRMQQDFQQLGQDLQAGNLSAARSDLAAIQQLTQSNPTTSSQNNNPITQEFNQLSQDLKSGNLSAAQTDYTKLQQNFQSESTRAHHSHHRPGGEANEINQLFQQLGQELQAGNLATAQQTYSTLQQDFQLNSSNTLFSGQSSAPNSISAIA